MTENEVIERVCRLASDFNGGSKSMVDLVAESNVGGRIAKLTVSNLAPYFAQHPDLSYDWLRWSASKRVTSGWFFTRNGADFVVGFFPKGDVLSFQDLAVACAEFVLREVRDIAKRHRKIFGIHW